MSEEERAPWHIIAEKEKEMYKKEISEYNLNHPNKGNCEKSVKKSNFTITK